MCIVKLNDVEDILNVIHYSNKYSIKQYKVLKYIFNNRSNNNCKINIEVLYQIYQEKIRNLYLFSYESKEIILNGNDIRQIIL